MPGKHPNGLLLSPGIQQEISRYMENKAPVFLLLLSQNGEIITANRHAEHCIGRDLAGLHFSEVILDFSELFDLNTLLNDPDREHLFNVRKASGLPQSYYFSFTPVNEGILVFGRLDAEELETMRREVLSLNQELNNLTRELQKKNAQLQRLNDEKNRFLGMAAHDLRKPIGLVITYAEFLQDEAQEVLDAEQKGFVKTIHDSGAFMKRLVDDFLDVSAIEAGRFNLDLHPASILQVLDKSLALNRLQADKKGIELDIRPGEPMPAMHMDAPKMEQVIMNLVSNAVEHSDPGSRVVISLSRDSTALTVSVQDFGPGIPPEDREALFQPFARARTTKTAGEKSTGLGLLITRKIIEAHNGTLWVDTLPGHGTTMQFQLPTDGRHHDGCNHSHDCGR